MKANKKTILPSQFFILLFVVLALVALLCNIWFSVDGGIAKNGFFDSRINAIFMSFSVVLFLLALWDGFIIFRASDVLVERTLPKSMSLGRWSRVDLKISHDLKSSSQVIVYDHTPQYSDYSKMPLEVSLKPGQFSLVHYKVKPLRRGEMRFDVVSVRKKSRLRFWCLQSSYDCRSSVKVFPDFSAISDYMLLALDNQTSQLGIRKKQRRGSGLEFHQLRDYRRGDTLKHIDWKATARRNVLIAKEFQDERDQHVVLMVDAGRRMQTQDDELSHFDHTLNALLLVSYIALRQGDSVSVMSFGSQLRWVPPQKGVNATKTILNKMYDLYADHSASDYIVAAEKFLQKNSKRSLVILVTNSRDEDTSDLQIAIELLRKKHIVLFANIREQTLDRIQHQPIHTVDDALEYLGLDIYQDARLAAHKKLTSKGVFSVDCLAKELAVNVANSYLQIKSAGVL